MRNVWVVSDHILTPLGFSTKENFSAANNGKTALRKIECNYAEFPIWTAAFTVDQLTKIADQCKKLVTTKFECFLYYSISNAIQEGQINSKSARSIFIFATSKGNIELMGNKQISPLDLNIYRSAQKISTLFGNPNKPIVISNACISGGTAIILAKDLLEAGIYDEAIVCGADTVNDFVLSGFNSLKALSPEPCKPFDKDRNGINLGEGAATVILKAVDSSANHNFQVKVSGGAVTNDANHISGPSRTGLELALAIQRAMNQAKIKADDIDIVSAHGTATIFNDEMEANAFAHVGLTHTLTNSLKGYFGHTLGAAGLIESIITMHSMVNNTILQSKGFSETGTTIPLNICKVNTSKNINHSIKTLAGFGGCDAALILSKK